MNDLDKRGDTGVPATSLHDENSPSNAAKELEDSLLGLEFPAVPTTKPVKPPTAKLDDNSRTTNAPKTARHSIRMDDPEGKNPKLHR